MHVLLTAADGLGYIKNPAVAPNLSVISAFHQLHCVVSQLITRRQNSTSLVGSRVQYTLRRAYYSSSGDRLEGFDFGLNRTSHTAHCFEYLRQTIMCSADSSVEPAEDVESGFLGWGFWRLCRDYRQLKEWAERWRAFDRLGFLAEGAHMDDMK